MEQMTGLKLGKEYSCDKAVYCHPAYLIYMQRISCEITGLDEPQTGVKIAGRNNLRHADDINLMAENERDTKEPR